MILASVPLNELLWLIGALLGAGIATGLLAGIFGVGGGAIIVPVLYEVFRLLGVPEEVRMQLCIGTSLAIIVPTSISSFRAHLAKGAVDMDVLKIWALPVLVGVLLGGYLAPSAPPSVFKLVFVAVTSTLAIRLLFGNDNWRLAGSLPGKAAMRAYGFGIGVASALMGVGGGAMSNFVQALYGGKIHRSIATSAGLGVIISIPGMIAYMIGGWPKMELLPPFSLGFVSLIGVSLMIPATIFTAPWGVKIAHAMPKRRLEIAFGIFLAVVAGRFLVSALNG